MGGCNERHEIPDGPITFFDVSKAKAALEYAAQRFAARPSSERQGLFAAAEHYAMCLRHNQKPDGPNT